MRKNKIIVIAGPTATGKTSAAIAVALKIHAEVVNFDSLLFYKELNIGTAKPTISEMQGIPHHMVNSHSAKVPINAADYIQIATPIINDIHARGKAVILVGGSGFYLQALLKGMYDSETTSDEIIEKSNLLYDQKGIAPFRDILKQNDFDSYERYHENDHYRIRRACEHFWMTGKPFSKARENMPEQEELSPIKQFNWDVLFCYLDIPKTQHFDIILNRTNQMIAAGLEMEVRHLLSNGFTGTEKPLTSIGYKEMIEYINGDFSTMAECSERISISTRQLAKAQRTWFKKIPKNEYNSLTDQDKIILDCIEFMKG